MDTVALDDALIATGGEGGVAADCEAGDGARELWWFGGFGGFGGGVEVEEALATFFVVGG